MPACAGMTNYDTVSEGGGKGGGDFLMPFLQRLGIEGELKKTEIS
jgi:hypothetical protein